MAYFKSLPKTTFTLPNGQIKESVNILKSLRLSTNFKENSNSIKKKYYDQIKRIENVSYRQYSNNMSLYWLVLMLNDIDSFSKVAVSQSKFEGDVKENYKGKVYYIADAKNTFKVLPDDLVLIRAGDEWKKGGIVKQHDTKFRRIILQKEFFNDSNDNTITDQTMLIYRSDGSNYSLVSTAYTLGRVENEYDKVVNIYDSTDLSIELSPYSKSDGTFDFSNEPSGTILNDLCNDTISGYKLYTLLEDENFKNADLKNLKFTNTNLAFKLNTFLASLSSQSFSRGEVIRIT